MLTLKGINRTYRVGKRSVVALDSIDLSFESVGFVAILGPSGCGKTTLLNIIGGLDRYTKGELSIDSVSTVAFSEHDWDAYRNHRIGFVFQNYNLIAHITVLKNVELALSLSGVMKSEREKRAKRVLDDVGLTDHYHKKPNQLSGGEQQRVAIARALVNDPDIILADEPTGAIDSRTSARIMAILKDISRTRLVIMVTHNEAIARTYSDRIIHLVDGRVQSDDRTVEARAKRRRFTPLKTAMSHLTALSLSMNNLWTKKIRTIMTSVAGSIGIIGVALVLSLVFGFQSYVDRAQKDLLAGIPIQIDRIAYVENRSLGDHSDSPVELPPRFPDEELVKPYVPATRYSPTTHVNTLTEDYLDYLDGLDPSLYEDTTRHYSVQPTFLQERPERGVVEIDRNAFRIRELAVDDRNYIEEQYDVLKGRLPKEGSLETVIVISSRNQLLDTMLSALGYSGDDVEVSFDELLDTTFVLPDYDDYYVFNETSGLFEKNPSALNGSEAETIEVVGILRMRPDASTSLLGTGIGYTADLTEHVLDMAARSNIVKAQTEALESDTYVDVMTGEALTERAVLERLAAFGAPQMPNRITIYPKSFEAKEEIAAYLERYNERFDSVTETEEMIFHTDYGARITARLGEVVASITLALIGFAAISLVVSSLLIGIVTYASVIERTKEIGILKSIGARKKDVLRVFNAEAMIIGLIAGSIGIAITLLLNPLLDLLVFRLASVRSVTRLTPWIAALLIAVSIALTLLAGLIPAKIAAGKDPVEALRAE
ncbi:MAG: ATP-binding cassette domain-containing protein [Acholeplasmataceae bacterium]